MQFASSIWPPGDFRESGDAWKAATCRTPDFAPGLISALATRPASLPEPKVSEPEITETDDAAWIARVRGGDADAAHALVNRLIPTITRSVRCHLPRRTSEEDLIQVVFLRIFKKLDQFSGLVPLEHWVSRIAINACIDHYKHEAVRPELRMADLSEEAEESVQRQASTTEDAPADLDGSEREVLGQLLGALKPHEREIITLLHLEERSSEEVSRITGSSISSVKVKAFRARRKMRRLWQAMQAEERAVA